MRKVHKAMKRHDGRSLEDAGFNTAIKQAMFWNLCAARVITGHYDPNWLSMSAQDAARNLAACTNNLPETLLARRIADGDKTACCELVARHELQQEQRWSRSGPRLCGWEPTCQHVRRKHAASCSVRGCVLLSGGEGCVTWSAPDTKMLEAQPQKPDDLETTFCSCVYASDYPEFCHCRGTHRQYRLEVRSSVVLFDRQEGCWLQLPPMPEPRVLHAMAVPLELDFWR